MAPTIVLIPGAWHRPSHYEVLLSQLRAAGFGTRSVQLPSVDPVNPRETTCANDVEYIRTNALLPELDAGNDIIALFHSYGGVPGGAAIKGLGRSARAGKSAVLGVVYMTSFIGQSGQALLPKGETAPWIILDEEKDIGIVSDPASVLYNLIDDESAVQEAIAALAKGHSLTSFTTPSPDQGFADADFEGRRGYIKCLEDRAVSAELQQMLLDGSGVAFTVHELEAGHSPYLSHPGEITKIVEKHSKEWA